MTVVSAFMMPGSPLPYVQRDNPPWGDLVAAMEEAGRVLAESEPDTIVVYSTQWIAVLDQLWQTRKHLQDVHVDENWHEYGDLPFDINIDRSLAEACVAATNESGIKAKGVDYDKFPIDTGTIVAANFMNPTGSYSFVITANNVYHNWDMTERLGRIAAEQSDKLGRRIAVVASGGLSGSFFRHNIDIATDHIALEEEDQWNRKILDIVASADVEKLRQICPDYAEAAKVDMGFKHMAFLLGAMGGGYSSARVLGYGPLYGSGGGVVAFVP